MPNPPAYQLPLFGTDGEPTAPPEPVATQPALTREATLASAASIYRDVMARKNYSLNTINSFMSDLNLLSQFLGRTQSIGEIGTKDLLDFLKYLREGRGVPCSPKSYQRRVTSLKNFFSWLLESEVLPHDPAAALINETVFSPLPEILFEFEIEQLLTTAKAKRTESEAPDTRPYLLLTLLLKTGIKKSECVAITFEHIDISRPEAPTLFIRYKEAKYNKKERKLALPADFAEALQAYRVQYAPKAFLFECTPRNLEYVLENLGKEAGVTKPCGFEILRMTCAVRDWQAGMDPDLIRQKLGLSDITWREAGLRIERLARPPL